MNWLQSNLNKICWALIVSENIVVVGTSQEGVHVSTDNGQTWRSRNENLGSNNVASLLKYNNYVFSGLSENGIYRTTLSQLTSVKQAHINSPDKFVLNQNYPNPFNPNTKISFSLPKLSFIDLKVYDITGKLIETLISEYRSSGFYEVNFKSGELSSGIYYYKLEADDFSQTKKMLLIK